MSLNHEICSMTFIRVDGCKLHTVLSGDPRQLCNSVHANWYRTFSPSPLSTEVLKSRRPLCLPPGGVARPRSQMKRRSFLGRPTSDWLVISGRTRWRGGHRRHRASPVRRLSAPAPLHTARRAAGDLGGRARPDYVVYVHRADVSCGVSCPAAPCGESRPARGRVGLQAVLRARRSPNGAPGRRRRPIPTRLRWPAGADSAASARPPFRLLR